MTHNQLFYWITGKPGRGPGIKIDHKLNERIDNKSGNQSFAQILKQ